MGSAGLARLHGLFATYKPPGLHWKHLRDAVEMQLLKGLNAGKPPAPEQRVRFLLGPAEGSEEKELTRTATSVPTLANHPLVRGPAFTSLKVGVGHRLDVQASGVLVLGVGHGCSLLTDMYNAHLTKDYTVRGLLGRATDDFCEDGRLVERTTYDHVTREKLDRILALIQGSHQKALVMHSNLDLQTQEAYELAVRGLIRPMNKSPMLIAGIRCLHFEPPGFLLGAAYARRLLHPGRRPPEDPVGPTQHPGRHPGRSPPGGSRAGEELEAGAGRPAAPWSRLAAGQRGAELCLDRLDSWQGSREMEIRAAPEPEQITVQKGGEAAVCDTQLRSRKRRDLAQLKRRKRCANTGSVFSEELISIT